MTTSSFSDALLALARPNLAWVSEQISLFDELVPVGPTYADLSEPTVSRSGVTLRGHVLGTYALDGTWLWAWANDTFLGGRPRAEVPGVQRCEELRALGEEKGVPELTEALVNLHHFPDPRLAADHLMLVCMGLLGCRGALVMVNNARGRAFLVTDDEAVPRAEPRAERMAQALRTGTAMLPGPALRSVRGYFAHHGLTPEYGPGRVTAELPCGDRVTVRVDGERVTTVKVVGPDGGAPRSDQAPPQRLAETATIPSGAPDRQFPRELVELAATQVPFSLRRSRDLLAHAKEHLAADGRPPVWDAEAGELRFPGGGLAARSLGRYDVAGGWFAWAPGTENVRARIKEAAGLSAGTPLIELDEDRWDLGRYIVPETVAAALARTTAGVAGYVFARVGDHFLGVDEEPLPRPETDPHSAGEDIKEAADQLHALTTQADREQTMRTLATRYFQRMGMPVTHYGAPDFLSGTLGLYETRVYFDRDGTITGTSSGLLKVPHDV